MEDALTTSTSTQIPGYVVGTWDIDPVHSDVSFTVRHMMVSKVRGRFGSFSGEIVTAPEFTDSTVTTTLDATSVDTGNGQRDGHLRTADFFAVETHPTWTFRSTAIRPDGDDYALDGELTIKGVTRPVTFALEAPSRPTASARTPTAAPAPASPPPPRSTAATSASTSPCRWTAAASS
jgi:polyisoprenoid-binding protein YceI